MFEHSEQKRKVICSSFLESPSADVVDRGVAIVAMVDSVNVWLARMESCRSLPLRKTRGRARVGYESSGARSCLSLVSEIQDLTGEKAYALLSECCKGESV